MLNAGSSTLKFALYTLGPAGQIERTDRGTEDVLSDRDLECAVDRVIDRSERDHGATLVAAGHRVVLGGLEHSPAKIIDDTELARLRALVPLAPLHQPRSLSPIDAIRRRRPALVQVACFDTAFHRTVPRVAAQYALPRRLTEAGAKRYGFHGLSYEYIATTLRSVDPEAAAGRAIVAHLGSGASLCALVDSRSVATTMGFSPLSGIMMATRPGDLDPALVLWLQRTQGMDVEQIESVLYRESGLAGVSGISSDMRVLLASDDERAREAIELFVYRIVRETGSLLTACGGLDALVFTGGIGEHAAPIRAAIARDLYCLGVELDEKANSSGVSRISTSSSKVRVWVIPTDEQAVIARHTAELALGRAA